MNECRLWFRNELLIELKESITIQDIDSFIQHFNVKHIEHDTLNEYVLFFNSEQDMVNLANCLYESKKVIYSAPDYYGGFQMHSIPPVDPRFPHQYYLYNSGQIIPNVISSNEWGMPNIDIKAIPVWNFMLQIRNDLGDDIRVAVIDDGVEDHADLRTGSIHRVLEGWTCRGGDGSPMDKCKHGQCVAGIIAAEHNNIGIAGIAPKTMIIPIRIQKDHAFTHWGINGIYQSCFFSQGKIARAIRKSWKKFNSDVLNCSWGGFDTHDIVLRAITKATQKGRDYKGCVVVASAGNESLSTAISDISALDNVISVGAIDKNGVHQEYSNYTSSSNAGISVVAFGGRYDHVSSSIEGCDIRTVDRTGTNGDGNSNTGLQMTCNGFTSNTYDIYVASGATMGPLQGSSIKGADNMFSGTQTSSLYNAGSLGINYYYSTGTNHSPQNPVGNVTLHTNAGSNDCASTLCVLDPSIPGPGPKSPTPAFLALKQQYENLMADFNRNGYADLLSTAIPPVAESPASPGELAAAQYASQQINSIAAELYAQSHEAVRALMADTLEDLQTVMAWLDATPGLASRYLAVETGFAAEPVMGTNAVETHGRASLQDIATHLTTAAERDEYDNYVTFHTLKQALAEGDHVMWPNATDAQIGELIRIADANTGRSSLLAKNVLCFFFGICYDDMEMRALETTTIPPAAESPTTGQQNITVHPNPTDDILHVAVTDGNAKIARVEMFDMFGRPVSVETHGRASLPSPQTTVNTSDIPSGLYLLRVTLTDGTMRNVKVVKR